MDRTSWIRVVLVCGGFGVILDCASIDCEGFEVDNGLERTGF